MRKLLTILLAIVQLSCFAQKKVLRKVMAEGRSPQNFYCFTNEKNKMFRLSEFIEFCKQNNWIVGNSKQKDMVRFGDVDETIASFEFIPKNEYPAYIIENMLNGASINNMSSQGSMFYFTGDSNNMFTEKRNVNWSGTLSNGRINGSGMGYFVEGTTYYAFKGQYQDGLPIGNVLFLNYNPSKSKNIYFSSQILNEYSNSFGNISDGMLWVKVGNQYGFVDTSGKTVVKPIYDNVKPFSGGSAVVTNGNVRIKIDKAGKVLGLDAGQKFSYDDLANMAKNRPELSKDIDKLLDDALSKETSFEAIAVIEKKFPEKYILTFNHHKYIFYKKDSEKIEEYFQQMKQSIAKGAKGLNGNLDIPGEIEAFTKRYSEYDPDFFCAKGKSVLYYLILGKCLEEENYNSLIALNLYLDYTQDIDTELHLVYYLIIDESVLNYFTKTRDKIIDRIKQLNQNNKKSIANVKKSSTTTTSNTKKMTLNDLNTSNIMNYVVDRSTRYEDRTIEDGGYYETYAEDLFYEVVEYEEWVPYYKNYSATIYTLTMKDFYGNGTFTLVIDYDEYKYANNCKYACGDYMFKTYEAAVLNSYLHHYGR